MKASWVFGILAILTYSWLNWFSVLCGTAFVVIAFLDYVSEPEPYERQPKKERDKMFAHQRMED